MRTPDTRRRCTTDEIAVAIGRSRRYTKQLLTEMNNLLVEQCDDGRWRLTADADARFAAGLRGFAEAGA